MPAPDYIQDFSEGDDANYPWSTRLPAGGHQWLLDVQSEWQIPNKSQTLRKVIAFAHTFFKEITEKHGDALNPRLKARTEYNKAQYEADERDRVLRELSSCWRRAMASEHLPTRQKLLKSGKELAMVHNINWPPPELTLIERDLAAKYILDRVLALIDRSEDRRVTFRDVIANSVGDKEKIKPVLEELMNEGYINMEMERRSGPPTVWITTPMLELFPIYPASDEL